MKVVSSKSSRDGKTVRVTVDVQPGERLVAINDREFYRLGHPIEDVVPGHVLTQAGRVYWCPVGQEWVPA